ncbi:MAG: 3-hydroxylacyl-ACP dehydratase [Proteobacteria bacterium]|nr:3-hydroxylacyl-ACP dehydratase [Pseudomonadota bacterium]
MTLIARNEILALIPHAGAMCLLDGVESWNDTAIACFSARHAAPDNPLRRSDGSLGAACGIELAAQAMAVHGRLTAPAEGPPRPGFLVSLRDVRLLATTLPPGIGPLTVMARRTMGDARGAAYAFTVAAASNEWLSGRATVLFEAPP